MLDQMDMNDKVRRRWEEVMNMDYMSSEDSDGNENELKIRRIPWLSENVQKFKKVLDEERMKSMSSQSKRQSKIKLIEGTSQRPKPKGGKSWIYKKESETA